MNVELITIGNELLIGSVTNTHTVYIGRKLQEIGAPLTRQICVNDGDIEDTLKQSMSHAELVITTGGLGPTSDDVTRNLVIKVFGLKTHVDEKVLENISARFARHQSTMPESVKIQAIVPDIATVFYNANGTAPGLAIPINQASRDYHSCKWLIMLPGPPRELRPMFDKQTLPFLRKQFQSRLPIIDCRIFKVAGIGESILESRVAPLLQEMKHVEIGYCARPGEVDLRLTVRGNNEESVRKSANEAETAVRTVLGDDIFSMGDSSLEQTVVELLRQKHHTLATAESCTGGYLAHRITLVPGSSDVFREGWVTYSNEAKAKMLGVPGHLIVEHGAVSEPVAHAMAEAALKKAAADYALGITGIAGPSGGSKEKPVGTVYISLASSKNISVKKFSYQYDRETFKFITTQTALNMLRKELLI